MTTSFNLVHQPWIDCITDEGPATLSLTDIFDGSHRVQRISGDHAPQDYAVLRLILAIFWRAYARQVSSEQKSGGRRRATFSWQRWLESTRDRLHREGQDPVVLSYLAEIEDRMDLFDPYVPFMQVPGLETTSGETAPVTAIIPESRPEVLATRSDITSISFAEAARRLVEIHATDRSGRKSPISGDPRGTSSGNPVGPGYTGSTGGVVVVGRDLLDTLVLNSTSTCIMGCDHDLPVWERTQDTGDPRGTRGYDPAPQGPADLATWQTRRTRLIHDDESVSGVVLCCGDKIESHTPGMDPMTSHVNRGKKKGEVLYKPLRHFRTRTAWRSLDALTVIDKNPLETKDRMVRPAVIDNLPLLGESNFTVELYGIEYGNQDAIVSDSIHETVQIPVFLTPDDSHSEKIREMMKKGAGVAEDVARAMYVLGINLSKSIGRNYGENTTKESAARTKNAFLSEAEHGFYRWVSTLDRSEPEERLRTWTKALCSLALQRAQTEVQLAGPRAALGHEAEENGSSRIMTSGIALSNLRRTLNDIENGKDKKK